MHRRDTSPVRVRSIGSATRALIALAVVVAGLLPAGIASVLGASATVHIGDTLQPAALTVAPGTTVTWVNDSGNRHRMRSTSGPAEFDSGDLDPGESFTFTFSAVGSYQYRDERNVDLSNYWGTVTVSSTVTPAPTLPPGATPPPASPAPIGDILMAGRVFSPSTVTIDPGTVVRWRNNDGREHTVTSTSGAFDSGLMPVGATFTRTFTVAGTFSYLCAIHPDMTGTVLVRTAGGATPPPPPPPTPTPKPTPIVTPAPGSNTVQVVDFAFNPTPIDITAGTTVTWINAGAALHTVTATDASFDSGLMAAGGGRFSRRFPTAGTFPYLCALHPSMTGVVRVSGPGGATPPPPAPPTAAPTPPPVASGDLELRDFAFVPASIRVTPGTTLTWVNTGAAPHTVTDRAGSFDSGLLNRGTRWSRRFDTAGTFQLLCSIHPEMHATLVVAEAGASAPPPATPRPATTPAPGSGGVAILDFDFAPQVLHVPAGTTVRWVNQGVAPHTATARDGSFDSGFLSTGDGYSRRFDTPGVVEYLCAIHPAMVGTVVVGDAAGGTGRSGGTGVPGAPSASPGASPSGDPNAPGGSAQPGETPAPGGAGGPGGGDGETAVDGDAVRAPLGAESLVRLALVALLVAAGGAGFVAAMRPAFRRS